MKKIIILVIIVLIVLITGITLTPFMIKLIKYRVYVSRFENSYEITNNVYFWNIDNNSQIEDYNKSNFDLIFIDINKENIDNLNKNHIYDIRNKFDIDYLKNNPNINKKSNSLGVLINASDLNESYKKISNNCYKEFCFIEYLNQWFIYEDINLSDNSKALINKYPKSFVIVTKNEINYFNRLYKIYEIENNEQFVRNISQISSKAINNKEKYLIISDNKTNITQLPILSADIVYDSIPIIKWSVNGAWGTINQSAHSVILGDSNTKYDIFINNYPIEYCENCDFDITGKYLSGKIISPFSQAEIIPETTLNSNNLSSLLQVWINWNLPSGENYLDFPLIPQINKIEFDYLSYEKGSSEKFERIGWVPEYDVESAITFISKNPNYYTSISPVWFSPSSDGSLKYLQNYNNWTLLSLCNKNDIKIIPTITMIDEDSADVLSEILNNNMDKHVSEIVNEVINNDYDGIDLDYERTYLKDKELLLEFISKLSNELHSKNKVISFTALSKWGSEINYGYAPQTRASQDWKIIGQYVDQFRIMTYDFRTLTSTDIGPNASLAWYMANLRYAQSNIEYSKVIIGMPLYSYEYNIDISQINNFSLKSNTSLLEDINLMDPLNVKTRNGYLTNGQAYLTSALDVKYPSNVSKVYYDEWNKENVIIYKDWNGYYYSSFLDKTSILKREEYAKDAGLGGVVFWRIINY